MRLCCNKYFEAVKAVTSKYETFANKLEAVANENKRLRTKNKDLSAKLFCLQKGLGSHTKAYKKHLSPKQKQQRLKFLFKRERSTRSK